MPCVTPLDVKQEPAHQRVIDRPLWRPREGKSIYAARSCSTDTATLTRLAAQTLIARLTTLSRITTLSRFATLPRLAGGPGITAGR